MALRSIGFIDTRGYVAAVASADEALKAADVHLINKEYVRNGMVSIILTGDVAAVDSAMDAAVSQSKRMNAYISHHVIARPDDQLTKLFSKNLLKEDPKPEEEEKKENLKSAVRVLESIKEKKEQQEHKKDTMPPAEVPEEKPAKKPAGTGKKAKPSGLPGAPAEIQLKGMKVEELRRLARNMNIKDITRNDIKFMKKKQLIELIEKNREKEV
jgi:microcompartment protein CcmL/EutN